MKSSIAFVVLGIVTIGWAIAESRSTGPGVRTLAAHEMAATVGGDSGPDLCCGVLPRCSLPSPNNLCTTSTQGSTCTGKKWYEHITGKNTNGCILPVAGVTYCFEAGGPGVACKMEYFCFWDSDPGGCFVATPGGVTATAPSTCSAMGCA